jgi:hypothetical protein
MVVLAITILNQHDKRVQQGEWTLLLRGRPNTQEETEAAQP